LDDLFDIPWCNMASWKRHLCFVSTAISVNGAATIHIKDAGKPVLPKTTGFASVVHLDF